MKIICSALTIILTLLSQQVSAGITCPKVSDSVNFDINHYGFAENPDDAKKNISAIFHEVRELATSLKLEKFKIRSEDYKISISQDDSRENPYFYNIEAKYTFKSVDKAAELFKNMSEKGVASEIYIWRVALCGEPEVGFPNLPDLPTVLPPPPI